MSDNYKCPKCEHELSGQWYEIGRGNRSFLCPPQCKSCGLPVGLWQEWQEMKDRIAQLEGAAKGDDAHRAASAIEILEGIVNARSRELEHLVLALDSLLKSVKGGDRNPDKVSE